MFFVTMTESGADKMFWNGSEWKFMKRSAKKYATRQLAEVASGRAAEHCGFAIVRVEEIKRKPRRCSAMDIAADACGLVKVKVNGKTFYE